MESVSVIERLELSGWEIWLQVEFAKFCEGRDEIGDWGREPRYALDLRTKTDRRACAVDFWVRQKHKHSGICLELKQAASASACIKAMALDCSKVYKIRKSCDDLRSVWCLGVHPKVSEERVKFLVKKHTASVSLVVDLSIVSTNAIDGTGLAYTVF